MNRYLILVLISIFATTLTLAGVEIQFTNPKINQGSLQTTTFKVDPSTAQMLEMQKLKGQTLSGTLYIYSVSPLLRKDGGNDFEAEAKVVFIKVPETPFVSYKSTQGEIPFTWKNIEVIPREGQQELIFGNFEVPARKKIMLWISILIVLIVGSLLGLKIRNKIKKRSEIKRKKIELKNDVQTVKDYENVVRIWQNKKGLIREFPHLEEPFKKLEVTLFKHQFKPRQTDTEKNEVMSAWSKFIEDTRGGFDGI